MCVTISQRVGLDQQQVSYLSKRVVASEHQNDNCPCKAWDQPAYEPMLYAITIAPSPTPIGILYANFYGAGLEVGWWIDKEWRSKKLSRPAVVEFAAFLRAKHPSFDGPIVAPIMTFAGSYDDRSRALLAAFKNRFLRLHRPLSSE